MKIFIAVIINNYFMSIKKSRTAKAIAGFVGFATAVTMSFGTASAATTAELQAQIASLLATIQGLQAQLASQGGTTAMTGGYTFATDLKMGSTGADVLNLQKVLNMDPATQVAASGVGSPGNESSYFGSLTKAAVIKFQDLHAADVLAPYGLTKGTGYVGPSTRAYLNSHYGSTGGSVVTPITPMTGGIVLSADTPAAGTVIAGQALADLAHFTFPNTTGADLVVTNLVFNRTGVSNDATLVNIYLYNGTTRLTDAGAVSSGKITFNDASGIFKVPAGGSVNLSVKADILGGTAGQIIGIALASAKAGTVDLAGTFPINGNNQSIATATMAGVSFSASPTPSTANTSADLQTGFVMWQDTVTVTTRAVNAKVFTFRQLGSATAKDIGTFQLFMDGVQMGTTVASADANGYVTFDLSAAPVKVETGSHTLKLLGDIVGGSTKTFSFSLQQAGDAAFADSQLGVTILPTVGASSFTSLTAPATGSHIINSSTGGYVTITKTTDSPSGNVVANGSNVLLAKYTLKAFGEPIKVEKIQAYVSASSTTGYSLRNGALFADGIQVGNTLALKDDTYSPGYTEYSLGSSLVVAPGTPVTLEVRADIYNEGVYTILSGDSITAYVKIPASGYKRMSALSYNDTAVTSGGTGNALAVAVGALSLSKNSAYANQTIVLPQTAYKLGSFTLTNTDAEAINLNTINVGFMKTSYASVGLASGEITDLYVKYGAKTTSIKATPDVTTATVSSANAFNINETLPTNGTMTFEVYGSLSSDISSTDTITTSLYVSGITAISTATKTSEAGGQTISNAAGSMASAIVTSSDTAIKLLVGNTTPKVASFRFTALNDTFTITDIGFTVAGTQTMGGTDAQTAVAAGAIRNFVVKSSGMADKLVYLSSATTATSTGLSLSVPANNSNGRVVDVYLNLNDVASSAATSGADVKVTLASYKALTSTGTVYNGGAENDAGNSMYVYKSVPTVTLATLPSTRLVAGTNTIAKFSIAADSAGPIGWKKMLFTITKTAATDLGGTSTIKLYDSSGTEVAGTFATTSVDATHPTITTTNGNGLFAASGTGGTLTFVATDEQQIAAGSSETYSLKDSVSGTNATISGTYVSTSIPSNTTSWAGPRIYSTVASTFGLSTAPSFVWTDRSANSHSESTADWNTDYKVVTIPSDTQTLSGAT